MPLHQPPNNCNAPITLIHDALVAAAEHRRLTPLEKRIRRLTAPLPWQQAGVTRSTWYRRRNRDREQWLKIGDVALAVALRSNPANSR
jgi:hypothetical protein